MSNKDEAYTDFAVVETQKTFLTWEEFPEGPFGSTIDQDAPVKNKDTPWKHGQQFYSNYTYEARNFHENIPRKDPGAHPTHDEKGKDREDPYNDSPTGNG